MRGIDHSVASGRTNEIIESSSQDASASPVFHVGTPGHAVVRGRPAIGEGHVTRPGDGRATTLLPRSQLC